VRAVHEGIKACTVPGIPAISLLPRQEEIAGQQAAKRVGAEAP